MTTDLAQDRSGAVPPGRGGDTDTAAEDAPERPCGERDAQRLGAAAKIRGQGPSANLNIRKAALVSIGNVVFNGAAQPRTPLVANRHGRSGYAKLMKMRWFGIPTVAGTTLNYAVLPYGKQMPAFMIGALFVPAVAGELVLAHGTVIKVNLAAKPLRAAEEVGVVRRAHYGIRKPLRYGGKRRGQQNNPTLAG